mmetsp:Transcript_6694/g.17024  ORF Transcript_6694/g.17024 Transcript_6694/m.17024 type:complete len:202 (+) Transcript_6694:1477-2082(+)
MQTMPWSKTKLSRSCASHKPGTLKVSIRSEPHTSMTLGATRPPVAWAILSRRLFRTTRVRVHEGWSASQRSTMTMLECSAASLHIRMRCSALKSPGLVYPSLTGDMYAPTTEYLSVRSRASLAMSNIFTWRAWGGLKAPHPRRTTGIRLLHRTAPSLSMGTLRWPTPLRVEAVSFIVTLSCPSGSGTIPLCPCFRDAKHAG